MKVYISCDIEGCAGIVDADQIFPGGPLYAEGRALMAGELNAAIEGALEGGARRVVANDSHGNMRNLSPADIHPKAELIIGRVKTMSMIEGLTRDFDAFVMIGYHAMAGVKGASIAHTYSSAAILEARLNGESIGEAGLNIAAAGALGVPAIFLSGDQYACKEARDFFPAIRTVETKKSLGRRSAQSPHPIVARERIRKDLREILGEHREQRIKPYRIAGAPSLEVDLVYEEMADYCERIPALKRIGARTVAYRSRDYMECYRALLAIFTVANAAMR